MILDIIVLIVLLVVAVVTGSSVGCFGFVRGSRNTIYLLRLELFCSVSSECVYLSNG